MEVLKSYLLDGVSAARLEVARAVASQKAVQAKAERVVAPKRARSDGDAEYPMVRLRLRGVTDRTVVIRLRGVVRV